MSFIIIINFIIIFYLIHIIFLLLLFIWLLFKYFFSIFLNIQFEYMYVWMGMFHFNNFISSPILIV